MLAFLWSTSVSLWTAAYPQHPRYPKGPIGLTSETIEASFAQGLNGAIKIRDFALHVGMPEIAGFMEIVQLELTRAAGLPEVPALLRGMQSRYESGGNKYQLAMTKMMEADDILSPPFSSPVVLNLVIRLMSVARTTAGK